MPTDAQIAKQESDLRWYIQKGEIARFEKYFKKYPLADLNGMIGPG